MSWSRQTRSCWLSLVAGLLLVVLVQPAGVSVAQRGGAYAPTFELSGAVTRPGTYDLARLQRIPTSRAEVVYITGSGTQTGTFVGTSLWELLLDAGVETPGARQELLRKYVVATGSDGYQAVLTLGELMPDFAGQPVLVAYQRDGQVLAPEEGMARLVVRADKRAGRNVYQPARLDVRTIDP